MRALLVLAIVLCPVLSAQQPNVLLIIGDDLGVDRIGAYAEVPDPGNTPVIDALAANGILFRNAYANPVCSPTRATLLTGRYGFRTGIGRALNYILDPIELSTSEVTLPQILAPAYRSFCIGKWHLSTETLSGTLHALLLGFEHHYGTMTILDGFISDSYYSFPKNIDGVVSISNVYNTTDTVNDALDVISTSSEPWFVYLAFNAPHAPYHKPPQSLHSYNLPSPITIANIPIHMQAMNEAMDTEIGRLMDSMSPAVLANTIIIFIGDNGTDKVATTAPFIPTQAKGTVYEGGTNVPLIVSGPGVAAGAECAALVNSTDIFATVADIAGVPHGTGTDSISIVPYFTDPALPSLRATAYTEYFENNGFGPYLARRRAVRDERYKLMYLYTISDTPTTRLFFDLQSDPFEQVNLLLTPPLAPNAQLAHDALAAALAEQSLPWADYGNGLAGATGIPQLTGSGSMLGGELVTLSLTGAPAGASVNMIIGLSYILKGFKGGVLVPAPDVILPGLVTDPAGGLVITVQWPAGMPSELNIYYQNWIVDPTGPAGLSASNALRSTTP